MMNPDDHARVAVGTGAAAWLLAVLLIWLLLPLLLGPTGLAVVLWYAAGWIPALLVYLIPFAVASTFKTRP